MEINKKDIENHLGYEISDFQGETYYRSDGTMGYSINVKPLTTQKYIQIKVTVTPTQIKK